MGEEEDLIAASDRARILVINFNPARASSERHEYIERVREAEMKNQVIL